MRTRVLCCSVLVFLQIMTWVSATSRLGAHNHALPPEKHQEEMEKMVEVAAYREIKKMGSRPPNCESKCYGCNPCVAIQVPTNNGHFSLQYSNYLPEGWKCKCGPYFYSP